MRSSASCAVPLLEDQKRASPDVNCPAAPRVVKKAASSWILSQPEEKSLNTSALVLPASRKTKLSWPPPPPTLSLPAPPSTQSVPSLPRTVSLPAPPSTESLPPEPWIRSLPPSPLMVSVLVVPESVSLPAVPLMVATKPPTNPVAAVCFTYSLWSIALLAQRWMVLAARRLRCRCVYEYCVVQNARLRPATACCLNDGNVGGGDARVVHEGGDELRRRASVAVGVVIELAGRGVVEHPVIQIGRAHV